MKKVLLGILVGAVAVYGYGRLHQPAAAGNAEDTEPQEFAASEPDSTDAATEAAPEPAAFHCDGREYCSQMKSYEEAVYFLRNCPGVKMDGDHDGVPCERQFQK